MKELWSEYVLPCEYGGWLFYLAGLVSGAALGFFALWAKVVWHKRWHRYWEKVAMGLERDCEKLAKEKQDGNRRTP